MSPAVGGRDDRAGRVRPDAQPVGRLDLRRRVERWFGGRRRGGMVAVAHGSDATGIVALSGGAVRSRHVGADRRARRGRAAGRSAGQRRVACTSSSLATARTCRSRSACRPRRCRRPTSASAAERLRVGLLDHDPELGLHVDPACAAAVAVAGRHLEDLGHHVEHAWPAALDLFWATAATSTGIVVDATRPAMIRWVGDRLGRPVRRGELDDAIFEAAARGERRRPTEAAAAAAALRRHAAELDGWFDRYDVLITPATFMSSWPLGGTPGFAEVGSLLAPFSLSGHPAAIGTRPPHGRRPPRRRAARRPPPRRRHPARRPRRARTRRRLDVATSTAPPRAAARPDRRGRGRCVRARRGSTGR